MSSGRANVPVDAYQANLQSIVTKLLADGVERVLLVTPSPVYDNAPGAVPHGEVRLRQGGRGGGLPLFAVAHSFLGYSRHSVVLSILVGLFGVRFDWASESEVELRLSRMRCSRELLRVTSCQRVEAGTGKTGGKAGGGRS